jgi:hypothetical protein
MFVSINEACFLLCKRTPEDENDAFFFIGKIFDDRISKKLPSNIFMRVWTVLSYG